MSATFALRPLPTWMFPEEYDRMLSKLPMPDSDRQIRVGMIGSQRNYVDSLSAEYLKAKADGDDAFAGRLRKRYEKANERLQFDEGLIMHSDAALEARRHRFGKDVV